MVGNWKCYSNIYHEELQLGKENTYKYDAIFLNLDIKIKDWEIWFGLFDKRDLFPFCIVRMPDKSINVPSSTTSSFIGAELLRIARASNILNHSPLQLNHLLAVWVGRESPLKEHFIHSDQPIILVDVAMQIRR